MAELCQCEECGKQYVLKAGTVGKKTRCKGCGQVFTISPIAGSGSASVDADKAKRPAPAKAASPAAPKPKAAAAGAAGSDGDGPNWGLLMDVMSEAKTKQSKSTVACPGCRTSLPSGTVLCTRCGTNVQNGAKYATTVEKEPPPPPQASRASSGGSAPPRPAAGRPANKKSRWRSSPEEVQEGRQGLAGAFVIIGILTPILAIFGLQFRILSIFGDYSVFMGIPLGIIAAIIYFANSNGGMGVVALVGPIVSMVIAFAVVASDAKVPQASDLNQAIKDVTNSNNEPPKSAPPPSIRPDVLPSQPPPAMPVRMPDAMPTRIVPITPAPVPPAMPTRITPPTPIRMPNATPIRITPAMPSGTSGASRIPDAPQRFRTPAPPTFPRPAR